MVNSPPFTQGRFFLVRYRQNLIIKKSRAFARLFYVLFCSKGNNGSAQRRSPADKLRMVRFVGRGLALAVNSICNPSVFLLRKNPPPFTMEAKAAGAKFFELPVTDEGKRLPGAAVKIFDFGHRKRVQNPCPTDRLKMVLFVGAGFNACPLLFCSQGDNRVLFGGNF